MNSPSPIIVPSMQVRPNSLGENRFYSYEGDLAHNLEDVSMLVIEAITGPHGNTLCRRYGISSAELTAGFAVLVNAFRIKQLHAGWTTHKCFYEAGYLNLKPAIREATSVLYGSAVIDLQFRRVAEASVNSCGRNNLAGCAPVDESFKGNDTFDIAAAMYEVAPDGLKDAVDKDKE